MGDIYLKQHILKAAPANANHKTTDAADFTTFQKPVPALDYRTGSVQVIWSGCDAVDATVTIQVSDDDTGSDASFGDKAGGVITIDAASGNKEISLINGVTEAWYRLKYAKGTNTVGVVDAYLVLKG